MKRCTKAFTTTNTSTGRPATYGAGSEVLDDDPILKTHGQFFEDGEEMLRRRAAVRTEITSAAPGEQRQLSKPRRGGRRPKKTAEPTPPQVPTEPPVAAEAPNASPAAEKD